MTVRQRIASFLAIGVMTAIVASGSMLAEGASVAAAQPVSTSQSDTAAASGAFGGCPTGYYCDYIYDNGYDLCFKASPFAGNGDIPNWSRYGCRNVDGAIYNNSPFTVRIYFAPNYGDPHACIKPFTKIRDLFNYDFTSGSGPHNFVIGNDIASSSFNLTPCTNPL